MKGREGNHNVLDVLVLLAEMYTSEVWWKRWTGLRLVGDCRFAVRVGGLYEHYRLNKVNIRERG